MRILLAEGDPSLASFLRKGLEAEHYAVDICADGSETAFLWQQFGYDLLLLDLDLSSELRQFDLLRNARSAKSAVPILALCGSTRAEDRAQALDLGADDVVARPFSYCELAARVRALLRRGNQRGEAVLRVADLVLSRLDHTVERAGKQIPLTAKEFALLEYLMRNRGRALSRAMIVEHVWNLCFDTSTNVVDVYINYLRRKLDDGFDPALIHTVRGVGYRLEFPEAEDARPAERHIHAALPGAARRFPQLPAASVAAGRTSRR
ncbi:MAG TPA: response regulator transcription factor [Candidatus Acidoferrales bacterium]|nr:response regulator transcription factor [Candidatus Acidoferrales bacterium]